MKKIELDGYCRKILQALQQDARQTVQQIADSVGLSTTPCWKRIKDMEAAGVIQGYTALINRQALGLNLQIVVEINLERHQEELVQAFERQVLATPHIVHCYSTTGAADYILIVLMADIAAYEQFLQGTLFKLPGVTHVRSAIVLKDVKSEVRMPV